MASKWKQLAPHFLAMFIIYFTAIIILMQVFDLQSFWISLAIALSIAAVYPSATRYFGVEPEPWNRS